MRYDAHLPSRAVRICQIVQAGVVIVRPIATRRFDWPTVEPIAFCVRCARQNVGLCSDDVQCAQKACNRNPSSYKLDHGWPLERANPLWSDAQFANDTGFGKKLLHLFASSLLVRDYAFFS
jgi:hypothetical protein